MTEQEVQKVKSYENIYGWLTNFLEDQFKMLMSAKEPNIYHLVKRIEQVHMAMLDKWKEHDQAIIKTIV